MKTRSCNMNDILHEMQNKVAYTKFGCHLHRHGMIWNSRYSSILVKVLPGGTGLKNLLTLIIFCSVLSFFIKNEKLIEFSLLLMT